MAVDIPWPGILSPAPDMVLAGSCQGDRIRPKHRIYRPGGSQNLRSTTEPGEWIRGLASVETAQPYVGTPPRPSAGRSSARGGEHSSQAIIGPVSGIEHLAVPT